MQKEQKNIKLNDHFNKKDTDAYGTSQRPALRSKTAEMRS